MKDINSIKKSCKRFSILYADDNLDSSSELVDLLKLFFKDVFTAKDGREALEIYYKHQETIDVVFTDINMPLVDGNELIEKIKENNPLEYIVVISAQQDLLVYERCLNQGVNGIILKPIISDKLIEVLSKLLKYFKHLEKVKKNSVVFLDKDNISEQVPEFFIDELTGVHNKAKLDSFLFSNKNYDVILVNIDNFDYINSKYGYKIGDEVLKEIANRLSNLANQYKRCDVFRVVSDEFVLLIKEGDINIIKKICFDVLSMINKKKVETQVEQFDITCTIGISSGKGQEVLRQAHIAVKESREIGKDKFYFFTNNSQVTQKRENSLKWFKKIKKILKNDSVIPYFQPIMDNKKGKIKKYEALARILEINRIVKPYYFLENAKLFNLLPNVTKIMLSKVFENIVNYKDFDFALNITEDDLSDENFVSYILELAKKYNIDNSKIIFEFVETLTISDNDVVFKNLKELKKHNFKLSIDDFGVNHLNFHNLHSIKIDYIKIYGPFIEDILVNEKSLKIVKSIVKLAHNIGVKTIAESVSSKDIQEKVKELGIDFSQGYFIGKPSETL